MSLRGVRSPVFSSISVSGARIPADFRSNNFGINSTVNLFDGFANINNLKQTKIGVEIQDAAIAKMKKLGFKMVGLNEKESEFLLRVIKALPDSLLSKVKGIKFVKKGVHPTKPEIAGEYDEDEHKIELYKRAFQQTLIRHGSSIDPQHPAMLTIVHEIGHAVDVRELRPKNQKINELNSQRNKLIDQYNGFMISPADKTKVGKQVDALAEQIKRIKKELKKLKSPSGKRHVNDGPLGTKRITERKNKTDFRKASSKESKVRITDYAKTDWSEAFAESFSIYTTSPETLKLLRPKLYTMLNKKYRLYKD